MEIVIHQALCGENENDKSNGFSLLKTTLDDKKIASQICPKTNLSDLPSSGIIWTPAVRGGIVDQYYLIMKTYADNSPNVRPGRMFSHVLIIAKKDVVNIDDISVLFSCFESEMNKSLDIAPIIYKPNSTFSFTYSTREKKVAQGIIDGKKNIIWIGQPNFEEMICKIWRGLDIEARYSLHFGIQFNPAEVKKDRFNILATPENISVQWRHKDDFFIIETREADITLSLAAESILGNNKAKAQFEIFGTKMELSFPSIESLKTWEWCIITIDIINKGRRNFADVKQLLLLICKYSNSKDKAVFFKQEIIDILIDTLKQTKNISDILSLKNADFSAIENGNNALQNALKNWCNRWLLAKDFNRSNLCVSIIRKLTEKKNISQWWQDSVREIITEKFNYWQKEYAELCWLWFKEEPDLFDILFPFIPQKNKQIENDLIEIFPRNIATDLLFNIASFAVKKKWYKLHAVAICEQHKDVHLILIEQLEVDKEENSIDGFEYIASYFRPLDFIVETANLNDERLWTISGQMLSGTNFIDQLDISHYGWHKIICKALQQGIKINKLFQYPEFFVFNTLDTLLQGDEVPEEIWSLIIKNELVDIYNYQQRKKAWDILPSNIKNSFLYATASTYMKLKNNNIEIEKELYDYLNGASFLQEYFNQNRRNLSIILHSFDKVNITNQMLLANFIYGFNEQLSQLEGISLGKIVQKKDWKKCAENIYEKSRWNTSYRIALQECYSLLGFLSRFNLSLSGWLSNVAISKDEWWKSFYKIACNLFPKGPNDYSIWEKADGKESELHYNMTGEDAWQKALDKLRKGGCKNITTLKLLKAMKDRYYNNQDLNNLIEIYKRI